MKNYLYEDDDANWQENNINHCNVYQMDVLYWIKLSSSDISYILNHSIHLEEVSFVRCNICDDGLIIRKEADKLKYLNLSSFCGNSNITDESILNLIKGCHNLKIFNIY